MGFHRNWSTRALLAVGGSSIDQALEWLGNHMDDSDIDYVVDRFKSVLDTYGKEFK